MTIHKEGFKILGIAFTSSVAIILLSKYFLTTDSLFFWLITVAVLVMFYLVLQFFRLPKRINTSKDGEIVAPCDGKVVVIEEVMEPEFFKDKRIQVSIFMSPLNVHCNWVPVDGLVKYVKYHPGLYLVAWHPKSSTENERSTIVFEKDQRRQVLVRQVAGAVARRIVYYLKEGQRVSKNDEIGFIKFGSRVDLYFPLGTDIVAKIGDITKGNETLIARW
jgi:phosphatidylserine decarboxylase